MKTSWPLSKATFDQVVMHSYNTLDAQDPGNPDKLVNTIAMTVRSKNAAVEVCLFAVVAGRSGVLPDKPWTGQPIENMALDVRAGYDLATAAPGVAGVNGVGEWSRAMTSSSGQSLRWHSSSTSGPVDCTRLPRESLRLLSGSSGSVAISPAADPHSGRE